MTHRPNPPTQYRLAGHLLWQAAGLRGTVVAALLLTVAACGSPPPRPDHGTYSSTAAATQAIKPYPFPRARRLAIAAPDARFLCVREWAERDLQGKGINFATLPFALDPGFVATRLVRPGALSADELAAFDGALVLAIAVELLEGPGGRWNAWSGAITSTLERLDVALAIYEPGNTAALWRSQSRVRAALNCPDQELKTQLQQLLAHIQ